MPASEPIEGIPWLLWRPSRRLRAPSTRAPIWVRSRRPALVHIGGLWLRLRTDRGVPLLAPVDHRIPVLAISTAGLGRAVLEIDSNLPVAEGEVPRLEPDPDGLRVQRRLPTARKRTWVERAAGRVRRRPGRPGLPPDFARPAVPAPAVAAPPARTAAPAPLAGLEMPAPVGVPEPVGAPRWYDEDVRRPGSGRAGRRTT